MKIFFFTLCITYIFCVKSVFGAEQGMPQLNPEFWLAQVFWLILIFSALYIAIWKVFLPKVTESIENRKLRVVNDLNETQKLKDNAEKKLAEYNKIIENAKKEAKKIVDENRRKLEKDIESKKKKFNEEIEKEINTIEIEIKNLKKSSIININKIATEISSELVKKIVETEVNMSNASAIVEDISKKTVKNYL
tara:strand:- start:1304 stop:1882 length:579 start_codon:yes stop_codon:yes gene_type:complete